MIKVLVVDDDPEIRNFLALLIKKTFRFEVVFAENGKIALEMISTEQPDIICLDISMPEMDGLEFIQHFKEKDSFKDTLIIVMSAINEKTTVARVVTYGVQNYILKPFNFSDTQARLKKIIYPLLEEKKKQQTKSDPDDREKIK